LNWKIIAAVVVVGAAVWIVGARSSGGVNEADFMTLVNAGQGGLAGVVTDPDLGRAHVPAGTPMEYRNDPPTSGTHWDIWVEPGFYDDEQPMGALVHALEHGNIVIYYGGVGGDVLDMIEDWVATWQGGFDGIVAVPRPDLGEGLILAAWTHYLRMDTFDPAVSAAFIDLYRGRGPEYPVR
jgi:hypothetical protein